jgi:hypothetical protein
MNFTEEQVQALASGQTVTVTIAGTRCVIIREDVYREDLDAGPWTREEIDLLADEAEAIISANERDDD